MRYIIALQLLVLITMVPTSCMNSDSLEDGVFYTNDNDIFYGIEILDNQTQIRFYISQEWSNLSSKEALQKQKNWTFFRSGKIIPKGDQFIVSELDSDMLPSQRNDVIFNVENKKIVFDCDNIRKAFYGSKSYDQNKSVLQIGNQVCKRDEIVYVAK